MRTLVYIAIFSLLGIPSNAYPQAGTLDLSFSGDGYLELDFRNRDLAYAVALQPDGKILVLGTGYGTYIGPNNYSDPDIILFRLNWDGTLDTTFDGNGIQTDFLYYGNEVGRTMVLQPDGKILIGGWIIQQGNQYPLATVWRINPDGTTDTNFGNNGVSQPNLTPENYSQILDIALQPDGKILFTGLSKTGSVPDDDLVLGRLTANGNLDPNFSTDGIVTIYNLYNTQFERGKSIELQANGKIMVTADVVLSVLPGYTFALMRFNTDGVLDQTFGNGSSPGVLAPAGDSQRLEFAATLVDSNDKILVHGDRTYDGNNNPDKLYLARRNPDGSSDATFYGNANIDVGAISNDGIAVGGALAIQSDGKVLMGGGRNVNLTSNSDAVLARYNFDGSTDSSFGNAGMAIGGYSFGTFIKDMAVQPDGKIVTVGWAYHDILIARYNDKFVVGNSAPSDFKASLGFFPNPTQSNGGNLTFELPRQGKITVRLLDLTGHEIMVPIDNEARTPGVHNQWISLASVPAGCYLLQVQFENSTSTLKLIHRPF